MRSRRRFGSAHWGSNRTETITRAVRSGAQVGEARLSQLPKVQKAGVGRLPLSRRGRRVAAWGMRILLPARDPWEEVVAAVRGRWLLGPPSGCFPRCIAARFAAALRCRGWTKEAESLVGGPCGSDTKRKKAALGEAAWLAGGRLPSQGLFCGPERDRTADLLTASQALSQLSYRPKRRMRH